MEILPKKPSTRGPAEMFTGDVWFDVIYAGQEPSRMRANTVRFAPCARTAWHPRRRLQTLHVTEGTGLVQPRGLTTAAGSATGSGRSGTRPMRPFDQRNDIPNVIPNDIPMGGV